MKVLASLKIDCFEFGMDSELTPKQKEAVDWVAKRFAPLFKESDRGCVLLAVARLDEALGALHRDHISATTSQSKKVLDDLFRPLAPLASFSGRIQIGYAYGLISKDDYVDFEMTRGIRNSAAHSSEDFTFEDPVIREKILKIKSIERLHKAMPEMGVLTNEQEQFVKAPDKDKNSVKLYFLTSCSALENFIMAKHLALFGGDLRETIKRGNDLLGREPS